MVDYTAHFRFGIPDFRVEPWHEDWEALVHAIDTAIYQAIVADSVVFWTNSTAYTIGRLVIDSLTGIMYTCGQDHTSPASPTTFAADRLANPARWNATANIPQQKGNWQTATQYIPGDFVLNSNRYAVCLVGHVSGVFNTDLAAGKWSILVDLSALGVGFNSEAEGTLASGATTNIGGQTPTRLFITGNTTITSFGNVANTYKILRFQQALNITPGANIILTGGASPRITDAGGMMILASDSTGKWYEIVYTPGTSAVIVPDATTTAKGVVELATTAETQALADTTRAVTPAGLAGALSDLSTSILNTIRAGVSSSLDTLAEIATAMGFLAPAANPTFTGTITAAAANFSGAMTCAVTPALGDNDTSVPNTNWVQSEIADHTKAVDGASMVLIVSTTYSGVTNLDYDISSHPSMFDGTYKRIIVEVEDHTQSTDDSDFCLRVGTGTGPVTYHSAGTDYDWGQRNIIGTSERGNGSISDSVIRFSDNGGGVGIGNSSPEESYHATIKFGDLSIARRHVFRSEHCYISSTSSGALVGIGYGTYDAAGIAITGLRFMPDTGNMSGRISIYGLKHS